MADPGGKRMHLRTVRLVSFAERNLAAIEYELFAEDADAEIVISSELANRQPLPVETADPRVAVGFVGRVLQPLETRCERLRYPQLSNPKLGARPRLRYGSRARDRVQLYG